MPQICYAPISIIKKEKNIQNKAFYLNVAQTWYFWALIGFIFTHSDLFDEYARHLNDMHLKVHESLKS